MDENHQIGKECKRGHTVRYKSSNSCVQCSRDRAKAWPKDNPEKAKAYDRKYHYSSDKSKEKWLKDNPEKRKISANKYNNSEKGKTARRKLKKLPEPTHAYPENSLCECCNCAETKTHPKSGKLFDLAYHHDHKTLEFIGWWCEVCNRCEGIAKGSTYKLRALANFIEDSEPETFACY